MGQGKFSMKEFKAFQKANPRFEFNLLNPENDIPLDGFELSGPDKRALAEQLCTCKRLSNLHDSDEVHEALLENGFVSALQISSLTENHFTNTYAGKLGVDDKTARVIHKRAVKVHDKTMHLLANIKTTVGSSYFRSMQVNTLGDDIIDYFEKLPSYQELFGSLDYCECDYCKSIFGPAAYFVDLMRIVDKYITVPNKDTIPAKLSLNARRPDLEYIPLTCSKTNDLVPYLQIVNERLLDSTKSLCDTGSDDPFKKLATDTYYPFNLPFNLFLEQIRICLQQAGTSLENAYRAWMVDGKMTARENMGLSMEQYDLLKTQALDDRLAVYYGLQDKSELPKLSDVAKFLESTGLQINGLNTLLLQSLSDMETGKNIAHNFYLNQGLPNGKYLFIDDGGQTTPPSIQNLNNNALDRINRFLRLSQKLSLGYDELDWILRIVSGNGAPAINEDALTALSQARLLAEQLDLDIAGFCSLLGPVKTYGEGKSEQSIVPFDIIFNNPNSLKEAQPYHPAGNTLNPLYTSPVRTWTANSSQKEDLATAGWLSSSLSVSIDDLNQLGQAIFGTTAAISLTVDNLSVLYRHSLMAKKLRIPVAQYLIYLKLCKMQAIKAFTLANIALLLDLSRLFTQAGFNVYQLDYFINGQESPYAKAVYQADSLNSWLQSLWQGGDSEAVDNDKAENKVLVSMSTFLGTSKEMLLAVIIIVKKAVDLPAGVDNWAKAFLTAPAKPGDPSPYKDYIDKVMNCISRWLSVSGILSISQDLIGSIGSYPASYGFAADLKLNNLQNVADVYDFNQFFLVFSDSAHDLLKYVETQAKREPEPIKILAGVTGWDATQAQALITGIVPLETNMVKQIEALKACFDTMGKIGADNSFLTQLIGLSSMYASNWDTYGQLADSAIQRLQSQYDISQWPSVFSKVKGQVEVKKRDALLSIVLWKLHLIYKDIKTPDDVYKFLLVDVEMNESTQISYVKEALNAVQLYLQRCRLKLERGVVTVDIKDSWWSWIMNYRMWEANRKIFLYPENYLVPSIRHTKTKPFEDLEDSLQQSEVTDAYVESVYSKYMEDFSAIAQLTPVETYYCKCKDADWGDVQTLFVFGRTKQQPYTYYYCKQEEGMPWTEWEKIDVSINSKYITPVFVFNRLFIFWAEIKKTTSTSIDSTSSGSKSSNSSTYKMEIYYSFLDIQGKWVNPQSLVSDFIAYYTDSSDSTSLSQKPPYAGLYDMDSLPWMKVYAFPVTAGNIKKVEGKGKDFERLSILFGPFVNNTGKLLTLESVLEDGSERKAFESNLFDRSLNFNRMVGSNETGYLSANPNITLNSDLEEDFLMRRNEFVLVDGYFPNQAPIPFKPIVDKLNNFLGIVYSQDVLYDNYLGERDKKTIQQIQPQAVNGNSFTSESITNKVSASIYDALKKNGVIDNDGNILQDAVLKLDLESVLQTLLMTPDPDNAGNNLLDPSQLCDIQKVLFSNMGGLVLFNQVGAPEASINPVRNQPGWFVYNNGDEAFLLSPQDKIVSGAAPVPRFSNISASLTASRALMDNTSYMSIGLDYATSKKAMDLLRSYALIDNKGIVDVVNATPEMVKMVLANIQLKDKQINAIYRMLQNFPTVCTYSFVSRDILKSVSEKIYTAFKIYSIIDDYGRVDLNLSATISPLMILGDLISNGTIKATQVPDIYDKLVHAPAATSVKYWNSNADPAITRLSNYKFDVDRLTTNAIGVLKRHIFTGGIKRLLSLDSQNIPVVPVLPFDRLKPNKANVVYPSAIDGTQVDFDGLYGEYYWELFFHVPMLLAGSLQTNNQNMKAQEWYHYIFNPTLLERVINNNTFSDETDGIITPEQSKAILDALKSHNIGNPPAPIVDNSGRVNPKFNVTTDISFLKDLKMSDQSIIMIRNVLLNYILATPSSYYWQFQPFRTHVLQSLQDMLSDSNPAVKVYNDHPFDPYAIARLRMGAFEKNVVMQYIDNLVQWGDQMFMQDTWESITAATMLYVLAFDLLGPRPVNLGPCKSQPNATFKDIREKYKSNPGGIPQFLIDLETIVTSKNDMVGLSVDTGFNDLDVYFGIPENDKLMGYWDIVEDRLYKIRNSMNIKGEKRSLALFEPPINPMLLAKAAAYLNNVMQLSGDSVSELAHYRFMFLIDHSKALSSQLSQLGTAMLSALEKNDAENLSLLHTTQEAAILNMTTSIKENQIQELNQTLQSLQTSLQSAQYRQNYYTGQISAGLSEAEKTNLVAMEISMAFSMFASILKLSASIAHAVPQMGSPFAMTYGGIQLGSVVDAVAGATEIGASIANFIAQRSLTMAGYQRRSEEWVLQREVAGYEVQNISQQIQAAQTRVASANQELSIHKKSIDQKQEIYNFLKSKFTNTELYQWMGGRLSSFLWQTYLIALDLAYQAQRAFNLEMDCDDTFINFNYWDSRRKGLLAGEGLTLALNQMEAAYIKKNNRRLEIEKTISLAATSPDAFLQLKSTGKCNFKLTEELYDYDFPGNYARKIKSVSISIPAVVGPYQNIKATLIQTYNAVVTKPMINVVKYLLNNRQGDKPADGFRENWLRDQKIAVSKGVDDSGMFTLNFNDERYLPFEDTGAVSDWELEIPKKTNRFNFDGISDVILNVKYTALDDSTLRENVEKELAKYPCAGGLYYNLKQNFANCWYAFMNNHDDENSQKLEFNISSSQLSYFKNVKLKSVYLRLNTPKETVLPQTSQFVGLTIKSQTEKPLPMTKDIGEVAQLNLSLNDFDGPWSIKVDLTKMRADGTLKKLLKDNQWLDADQFKGLEMILLYEGNFLD